MTRKRDRAFLGSARVPRAGFGVAPKRTLLVRQRAGMSETSRKVRDREDALASTWNARALPRRSLLSVHQPGCLLIERLVIGFARAQVKFVDHNVDERGSVHGQKTPDQSEHRRSGDG